MKRELNTVDLFCDAGGASTGMEEALARLKLSHRGLAINHWSVAVDTMRVNHPKIDTKRMAIEEAVPADLVPGGEVDLLWASPSCTHHSRAKGGKPRSNQLRAQPELVLTWLDQLFVRRMIIENVPEFTEWGPLTRDGRPIEQLKGSCFRSWVAAIEARNYTVEWRILNCADYGDATTRRRFFLQAVRKGCGKIVWPEPEYAENPKTDLWGHTPKRWRGIRECLDFSNLGRSIFEPGRNLAMNTLRRVDVGMRKFNGMSFLMDMLGADGDDESRVRPLSKPMPTQHAGGNRCAVVRPFIVTNQTNNAPRSIDRPIRAQTTVGKDYLCTPLVLGQQGGAQCQPIDKPCPTIATAGAIRLSTPLIIDMSRPGGNDSGHIHSADEPIQTITSCDAMQLAVPIVLEGADLSHLPRLPDGRYLDIRLRMLKPLELAAAHSFPKDYKLTGNRTEQVKQIGNSVPVMTAAAICEAALRGAA